MDPNHDETDVKRVFSFMKKKNEEPSTKPVTDAISEETPKIPAPNEDNYNMNHKNRGIALIFNHYEFDGLQYSPRKGTDIDCRRIEQTLESLKFDVRVFHDLKYGKLQTEIKNVARMDHTDNDCLVIVVMTHGNPNTLQAKDEEYYVDALWKPFSGTNCPSLAGKPKLFFFQACRGEKTDPGIECRVEFDGPAEKPEWTIKIPSMADFLFMYPTQLGYYSFRSPQNGSWFIQALCEELNARAQYQDLQTILTLVNRRMAYNHISNVPSSHELHAKKQVGSIVSSLTRLIYFH